MKLKADLMSPEDMRRALKRMSHQILERNQGADNLVLLGIRRRGVPLAKILSENIKASFMRCHRLRSSTNSF